MHEAWSQLLEGFLPYLADEAAVFADVLLMYRGDEDQLRLGPTPQGSDTMQNPGSKQLDAGARSLRAQHLQRQQQRAASSAVEVLRPPGCPLTANGVKAVESMMIGLEAEFTVRQNSGILNHLTDVHCLGV